MARNFLFVKFPGPAPDGGTALRPCFYMCYQCNPVNCFFPPSPPPPPQIHRTQRTPTVLIVILCVLSIVLLLISYVMIARYRNFRRRSVTAPVAIREDGNQVGGGGFFHHVWSIQTDGFSQSLIDSIATIEFKPGGGLIDGPDCAVCLNEFQERERLRLLPKCSHAFHVTCIDTWLRAHQNCPVCRAPIVIGDTLPGNSVIDGQDGLETGESEEASGNGPGLGIQGDAPSGSDLDDQGMKLDLGLQPVRRSVSMDFSSRRGCNCRLVKSYSYGRVPVSM